MSENFTVYECFRAFIETARHTSEELRKTGGISKGSN